MPASLIYLAQGRLPMKTRAFIDFAVGRLRDRLSALDTASARLPRALWAYFIVTAEKEQQT